MKYTDILNSVDNSLCDTILFYLNEYDNKDECIEMLKKACNQVIENYSIEDDEDF